MLYNDSQNEFVNEHLSIVAGEGFVLTFQEADGDVFDGEWKFDKANGYGVYKVADG